MLHHTGCPRSVILTACLLAQAVPAMGQQPPEAEARGFVSSVAATVYGSAWPTATYERSVVRSVSRVPPAGVDILVRLSGQSHWGGELWVDLVFVFRRGGFFDLKVSGHNAIMVPPFATLKTVGAMTLSLAEEFAGGRAAGAAGAGPRAAPPARRSPARAAPREIRLANSCGHPIRLWLRYRVSADRWRVQGVWSVDANDTTFLADADKRRLRLAGPRVAYYAEIPDGKYSWSGTIEVPFGTRTVQMREATLPLNPGGAYRLSLKCANYTPPAAARQRPSLAIGVLLRDLATGTVDRDGPGRGLLVAGLQEGLPAKRAGLHVGDRIMSVDGRPVRSGTDLREHLNREPLRPRSVVVVRAGARRVFRVTPTVPPTRPPLDHQRCQDAGNPPDYYVGAFAAPFFANGEYIVPLYPGVRGRLFDPGEVDVYSRARPRRTESPEVFLVYGKPLRDDLVRFDYYDRDRALIAVTEAGETLDTGVRINCLVQPGMVAVSELTLRRMQNGEVVSSQAVPLRQVR